MKSYFIFTNNKTTGTIQDKKIVTINIPNRVISLFFAILSAITKGNNKNETYPIITITAGTASTLVKIKNPNKKIAIPIMTFCIVVILFIILPHM